MPEVLSTTEAKQLVHLCKTGRLFEVQEWIEEGKPISVSPHIRPQPLIVAIDAGFHSMVEVLARAEPSRDLKNRALLQAVTLRRLDLIQLLVANGAEITSVQFVEVLRSWEPKIVSYFIDEGADVITHSPFAVAFGEKIRTALRLWKECKEKFPDLTDQLQEQGDQALRYFCERCDLKWVSLLMWAGADPRSRGPTLDEHEPYDPELFTTAMESAAGCHDVSMLKRLKPQPNDNLALLLEHAGRSASADTVVYLTQLGAEPNDKPNGGSTALQNCLESFEHQGLMHSIHTDRFLYLSGTRPRASRHAVSKVFHTVEILLQRGALWKPETRQQVDAVRRSLFACEPAVTSELVRTLLKGGACSKETLNDLLRTPAMQKHLTTEIKKLKSTGFDVRTAEQRAEDERRQEHDRLWTMLQLARTYNRKKLYEEVWSEPIQHVARRYNLSDVGLAKICSKLNIPRPGKGYWAIKAAGKRLPKQPRLEPLQKPKRPHLLPSRVE